MESDKDTKLDKAVKWLKNKSIVVAIIIIVIVIAGLSKFISDGKSIIDALSPAQSSKINQDSTIENAIVKPIDSGSAMHESNPKQFNRKYAVKEEAKTEVPIFVKDVTGDVVISQNQQGGITAHTVITKPEKRSIKASSITLIDELKKYPVATYRLHYSSYDLESVELANEIDAILQEANWQRIHPIIRMGGHAFQKGVTIFMLKKDQEILALTNQLWYALGNKGVKGEIQTDLDNIFKIDGWSPQELPNGKNGVVIFIGPNPEN